MNIEKNTEYTLEVAIPTDYSLASTFFFGITIFTASYSWINWSLFYKYCSTYFNFVFFVENFFKIITPVKTFLCKSWIVFDIFRFRPTGVYLLPPLRSTLCTLVTRGPGFNFDISKIIRGYFDMYASTVNIVYHVQKALPI